MTDFIIGDLHVPYHDLEALDVLKKMIRYHKPKNIIMNGDMLDCATLSRFSKEPPEPEAFKDQLIELCGILSEFQKYSKLYYIEGNHEARLNRYINDNAPELYGLISYEQLLQTYLKKKVTYIRTTPGESMMTWGKDDDLLIGHFNRVSKNTCYTVKMLVEKYMTNVVQAHVHRLGQYALRGYGQSYRGFESGCLCDLNPSYVACPNWQQGFLVYSAVDDFWNIENVAIQDGKALFRGKLFVAEGD